MLSSAAALSLQRFRHGARRPPLCCDVNAAFFGPRRATELAAVKTLAAGKPRPIRGQEPLALIGTAS